MHFINKIYNITYLSVRKMANTGLLFNPFKPTIFIHLSRKSFHLVSWGIGPTVEAGIHNIKRALLTEVILRHQY